MGNCLGFDLANSDDDALTFAVINSGGDALCVDGVDVYSARAVAVGGGMVPPSARCRTTKGGVWTERSEAGPVRVQCRARAARSPRHAGELLWLVLLSLLLAFVS